MKVSLHENFQIYGTYRYGRAGIIHVHMYVVP